MAALSDFETSVQDSTGYFRPEMPEPDTYACPAPTHFSNDLPKENPGTARAKPAVLETILAGRERLRLRRHVLLKRLTTIGLTFGQISIALQRSKQSGASLVQELIAYNEMDAERYYQQLAEDMNVEYVARINPSTILSEMSAAQNAAGDVLQVFGRGNNGLTLLYVSPDFQVENAIFELIERDPGQKQRIRICSPKTITDAMESKFEQTNLQRAVNDLHQKRPALSAKQVFAPWQAYVLGLICAAIPIFMVQNFSMASVLIQLCAMTLFFFVVLIRIFALRKLKIRRISGSNPEIQNYPTYSVLVALHKEAAVVGQLVDAMSQLDWPSSRLEVLYVCEADDYETIGALQKNGLPARHRIVSVPPGLPRTKPKALNYALHASSGDYVVIYDAEDRPHHQQLKEAWSRFSTSDHTLACLQSPLSISNANASWFSRMFAFEYGAHFKGLLPYLAESGVPLPLGGTSNHFRRSALEMVGGWDPHNVTEDADLGIRFYRFGFKCGTLERPTLEDGPEILKEWLPQRTRWQKGWMQTFLVQNRNMFGLYTVLGGRSMLHFEAVMAGFILSPLLYSISILLAAYSLYSFEIGQVTYTLVGLIILLMGYFCSVALGLQCNKHWSLRDKVIVTLTLPFYWLLISAAAWRAVYQLIVKPHHWEKTPHRPSPVGFGMAEKSDYPVKALSVFA